MKTINPAIFREYDIRGVVDADLDEGVYETIGKAFGTYVKDRGGKALSLGRDCRLSSPGYARAMTRGITSTGVDVVDLGMVTTPMLYFSLYNLPVDGGVMITASHNPGEYNGVKLCLGRDSVFGEEIQKIREIADGGEFHTGTGTATETSVEEKYVEFLKSNVEIKPGLRLAVDYGNGMVGIIGPRVFGEFGCDVKELYVTPDGTFPNHHPDPTVEENVAELAETVVGEGFSLGIGFDGDGDRVGVVDGEGRIIWGDMLVLIYARDVLSRKKGAEIIGDVKCSNRLFEGIEEAGGKPIMWKTGHSLIKNKMKTEGAALAGEMSGHIFFADKFFGYDDALYAALRLLEIISSSGKTIPELLEGVPPAVSTPEIRLDCPEAIKFPVVELVQKKLGEKYKVIDIDGARIEFPDGWGLIRASNTQPALVLRFEARSEERMAEIRAIIETALASAMEELSQAGLERM